jgi:hypothetical protein
MMRNNAPTIINNIPLFFKKNRMSFIFMQSKATLLNF